MWRVDLLCMRADGAAGCCSDRLLSLVFGKPLPASKEGGNSEPGLGLRRIIMENWPDVDNFFMSMNKRWPANILFLRAAWVFHQHWLPCVWSWRSSLAGELAGQRYRVYEVDAHNRASTRGMSISKGIVLQDQQLHVNLVVSQRQKVFKRSVERLKIRRYTYVVTGLVSQKNQWEWRLSRISEVIMSAPDHFWLGSYFYIFGVVYLLHIVMRRA